MAFFFLTGVMGSGKSYFGTELCIECLKQGGTVHTNLPLKDDWFEERGYSERVVRLPPDPRKMVYEDPKDLDESGKPKLKSDYLVMGAEGAENIVVLDEAALEFDVDLQLDKGEKDRNKPIFKLVALCRHAGLDLYFISQSSDNVQAKLRRMAEQRIKCVKTERLPVVGWLLAMMPWYGTFLRIYFQGTDKTPIARTWHRWRPDVGEAYDTHGMRIGLDFKQGTNRKKSTETTQARGKAFAIFVVLLIVSLCTIAWIKGNTAYNNVRADTKNKPTSLAGNEKANESPQAVQPPETTRKTTWAEWDITDEHTFNSVVRDSKGVRVYTSKAGLLAVGEFYDGERIATYQYYAGRYFFRTDSGRYVVVRPRTYEEKALARATPASKTFKEQLFGESQ